jgi:hypothetical protein
MSRLQRILTAFVSTAGGPPLRFLQRWGLMQPASGFFIAVASH